MGGYHEILGHYIPLSSRPRGFSLIVAVKGCMSQGRRARGAVHLIGKGSVQKCIRNQPGQLSTPSGASRFPRNPSEEIRFPPWLLPLPVPLAGVRQTGAVALRSCLPKKISIFILEVTSV